MMNERQLTSHLQPLMLHYEPARSLRLRASFYPYKGLKHTIRLRGQTIFIRFSHLLAQAPPHILECLGHILLQKLFYRRAQSHLQKTYHSYVDTEQLEAAPPAERSVEAYTPEGKHYHLTELFDSMNQRFFKGGLQRPQLGWSLQNSYRRLGFYDAMRDLLVVTRLLDNPKTPRYVLEYIVYHEMLHMVHPVTRRPGKRRVIHSREFRKDEAGFPQLEQANSWIKRHLGKLSKRGF